MISRASKVGTPRGLVTHLPDQRRSRILPANAGKAKKSIPTFEHGLRFQVAVDPPALVRGWIFWFIGSAKCGTGVLRRQTLVNETHPKPGVTLHAFWHGSDCPFAIQCDGGKWSGLKSCVPIDELAKKLPEWKLDKHPVGLALLKAVFEPERQDLMPRLVAAQEAQDRKKWLALSARAIPILRVLGEFDIASRIAINRAKIVEQERIKDLQTTKKPKASATPGSTPKTPQVKGGPASSGTQTTSRAKPTPTSPPSAPGKAAAPPTTPADLFDDELGLPGAPDSNAPIDLNKPPPTT